MYAIRSYYDFVLSKSTSTKVSSITSTASKLLAETLAAKNAVTENLVTTENTIGVEFAKAIEATKGGSVNDIIAAANASLKEKVDTDEWNRITSYNVCYTKLLRA